VGARLFSASLLHTRPMNGKLKGSGVARCLGWRSRMCVRAGIPHEILQFSGTTRVAEDEIIAPCGRISFRASLPSIRSRNADGHIYLLHVLVDESKDLFRISSEVFKVFITIP
jgi:hypothetical protein